MKIIETLITFGITIGIPSYLSYLAYKASVSLPSDDPTLSLFTAGITFIIAFICVGLVWDSLEKR